MDIGVDIHVLISFIFVYFSEQNRPSGEKTHDVWTMRDGEPCAKIGDKSEIVTSVTAWNIVRILPEMFAKLSVPLWNRNFSKRVQGVCIDFCLWVATKQHRGCDLVTNGFWWGFFGGESHDLKTETCNVLSYTIVFVFSNPFGKWIL